MREPCIHHETSLPGCSTWVALLLLVLTGVCSARSKTDVIQFANGDRITCEIVKLDKGYLYVKLDYADGTVALDWSKIAKVESPQEFVVADKLGERYSGRLQNGAGDNAPQELKIKVTGPRRSEIVSGGEVVEIDQTDTSFWQNMHGSMDVGLNYTKQQNRAQFSLDSSLIYARTKWSVGGDYNSSFSGGGDISSLRNDLRLNVQRQLRSKRNYYMGLTEFLHNDEQQLKLRTTFGGALGHYFRRTNNSLIAAYGGATWSREKYDSGVKVDQTGDSVEAILGTQLNFFRFKTTSVFVDARVYPSLTDLGRTRFDLNTSLKLRITKNLYWNFGYYLNVDSRPPQDLPKTDYGSTSSLGWTF